MGVEMEDVGEGGWLREERLQGYIGFEDCGGDEDGGIAEDTLGVL